MTTKKYTPHMLALAVLFTLGNSIVLMQKINLINVALSFAVIFLVSFLLSQAPKSKVVFLSTALLIFLSGLYGATTTFIDYINFLKQEQLPQASVYALSLIFLLVVIAFSLSKTEAVYKFSLFTFVIVVVIIMLCFVGGIKNFDFKNIKHNFFDLPFSWGAFFRFCLPLTILPFISPQKTKSIFFGTATGVFILLLVSVQIALTFGIDTDVSHPYLKSIGVLSSGSLFSRLDGLVWFLFFVTCLIKTSLCIKAIIKIIKGGKNQLSKKSFEADEQYI